MQEKKRLILVVTFILTIIFINIVFMKKVQAITQIKSTEIDNIDEQKYPGIKQAIKALQEQHPNWKFKILYTDLEWNEVITNEYVGHGGSPRNLVPVGSSYAGEWICESCTENKYYDNGSWRCASTSAIEYMMDARNSINNADIFQFMELTYQECTLENIKPMVTGTFLDNDNYINAIIEAGRKHNVSPYYIVALAMQEQGKSGSSTTSGTYSGYEGYYNIFNINATGNNSATIITNALTYAKERNWNTMEASIDGGVEKISTSYIARGQNTLYLQKFDVDNSDEKLYWHQYQQNILAAQSEGVTIRKTFEEINSIESAYTFVIPVYKNMPNVAVPRPPTQKVIDTTNTEKVKINVSNSINLRATPGGEVIGALYKDEIVFRIEKATEKINGTYWDKVMRNDGKIGYVARETYDYEQYYKLYLVPVENQVPETPQEPETPELPPTVEPENPDNTTNELPNVGNDKVKIENETKQVTIIPGATVQEIINLVGAEVIITDKNGNQLDKEAVPGTGCKINGTYSLVMLGDVNGDGETSALDAAMILRFTIGQYQMDNLQKEASILAEESEPTALDAAKILRYTVGQFSINIQ